MRITIEGTTFYVSLSHLSWGTPHIHLHLGTNGGAFRLELDDEVDVVIHGMSYDETYDVARFRGLPILRDADLMRLWHHGHVDVDFEPYAPRGDAPPDAFYNELRGLFDAPVTPESWDRVVRMLDACAPERAHELADYVAGHTARWTPWERALCVAPGHWVEAMLQGQNRPALSLVRRLKLFDLSGKSRHIDALLGCTNLSHVTALELAPNTLKRAAFEAMATHARFAHVEELVLQRPSGALASVLDHPDAFPALRRLTIPTFTFSRYTTDTLREVLATRAGQRIETLTFQQRGNPGNDGIVHSLDLLRDPELATNCTHVVLDWAWHDGVDVRFPMRPSWLTYILGELHDDTRRRIQTLTLRTHVGASEGLGSLLHLDLLPDLHTLELFDAGPQHTGRSTVEAFDTVFHPEHMRLPGALKRLVTNAPLDRGELARLAARRPDLDVCNLDHEPVFTREVRA